MAGIPLFLQRIGRGTTSFDEPRSSAANTTNNNNNNNARSTADKRRSFDMGFVRRRASVSVPVSSKPPIIEPLSPGKPRRSRLLLASSPKFFAKVAWVDTLSQLATMVPLNQINIPQPVYEYNMKAEHAINMPKSPSHAARANIGESQRYSGDINPDTLVYGVPLEPLMNTADGLRVLPRPIRECIAFINHHGLATEGLFRRSPPSTALRSAKDGYNRGQSVDLALAGVHVAAVLLKLFFRELPEPVFSSSNYDIVRALPASISSSPDDTSSTDVAKQMDAVRARYVEEVILPSLRPEYRLLLCFVCALLHMVARNESANRMTAYSLAIVWAPNLARSSNPVLDVTMCGAGPGAATVGSVVQIMVQMFDRVFSQELRLILANFGGSSGGQETTAGIDQADEVLRIVDRMNRGEYRGVHVAAATPPKLPPRRVASPEAAAASSPAARPTPPLPPRRSVAEDQKADEGNRSDNDDEGDDDDGDTQMFADAESDSPAAKDPTKNEARAANKSPSVESSSLAESSLVEPSLAESAHSKNNDVQEASTAAPADAETETETEAKQQL